MSAKIVKTKPIFKTAIQFNGTNNKNFMDIIKFAGEYIEEKPDITDEIIILTLEGPMVCKKGDWIIRGLNGEFYSCKDDIFKKTYEIA